MILKPILVKHMEAMQRQFKNRHLTVGASEIGRRFGRLTVLKTEKQPHQFDRIAWYCGCECGTKKWIRRSSLLAGYTQSCGCLQREDISKRFSTHRLSKHPLYQVWSAMHRRCSNPKQDNYKYYGGRGIRVCRRWHRFENFFKDMKPTWREGLELDRKHNDKNYCKANCRWATHSEQVNNRRPSSEWGKAA